MKGQTTCPVCGGKLIVTAWKYCDKCSHEYSHQQLRDILKEREKQHVDKKSERSSV